MRAAIYARFSTDKQQESSITDQMRGCEEWAKREGWTVVFHYKDEAISGAATQNRPGFKAMEGDALDGKFDVLLVMELSRLSRSAGDLNKVIDRLVFRGIRIVGVANGYDSARKGHKLQVGFEGVMGEAFREMVRDKTYAALYGRAQRGSSAGGKSYGYLHSVSGTALNPILERSIIEAEAGVIRQIFSWYADGHSPRWIAGELNRQGVPSPRGGRWAQSAIYGDAQDATGILNNELYIGRQVWNRREWRKDPDTGKRTYVRRPRDEWITAALPHLRIVPDELWDRVKRRQAEVHKGSIAIREALDLGKPGSTGRGPKYLFSGLLKCACCGANYVICGSYAYGCAANVNGGDAACSNRLRVTRRLVELRLLDAIREDLFSQEAIQVFITEAGRLLREATAKHKPEREHARAELAAAEREIENLINAIRTGLDTPSVRAALNASEAEKLRLQKLLAADTSTGDKVAGFLPQAVERYHALVNDLPNTLARDIGRARAQLRTLLGDIKLNPAGDHLEAELCGSFEGLMTLTASNAARVKVKMVAGAGFEPATFRL
jgi:site-specific DNA recombinase